MNNANTFTCPACSYTGHGFKHVELIPHISEICRVGGALLVRLDRAEPRPDEVTPETDRIECPACAHEFPVPEEVRLTFTPRSAAA